MQSQTQAARLLTADAAPALERAARNFADYLLQQSCKSSDVPVKKRIIHHAKRSLINGSKALLAETNTTKKFIDANNIQKYIRLRCKQSRCPSGWKASLAHAVHCLVSVADKRSKILARLHKRDKPTENEIALCCRVCLDARLRSTILRCKK